MNWYLRKQDQTIYGPVSEDTLASWAATGRVLPDDEVSADQKKWKPAPQLAALNMEWVLDLGEGERFGPLHVLALAELARDGSVLPGQLVQHTTDQSTCTLAEAVLPAILAQPTRTTASPAAAPVVAADPEVPRLREALAVAEARIAELERPRPPVVDPELTRLREALNAAETRIAELAQPRPALADPEVPRLREALAAAEARVRELEGKALQPVDIQLADGTVDGATLLQSYRELSQNYDRLLGQLNDKSQELARTVEAHARVTKDLETQLTSAHETALTERREIDDLRVRMAELEKTHMDVVRAYRDLNDRYIRLRQQQNETGTSAPPPRPADKPKVRLV